MPRFFKRYLILSGNTTAKAAFSACPYVSENISIQQADQYWVRLFKFPQMDFEMAIWEMSSLLIAPKKVFRSMYYHVSRAMPKVKVS